MFALGRSAASITKQTFQSYTLLHNQNLKYLSNACLNLKFGLSSLHRQSKTAERSLSWPYTTPSTRLCLDLPFSVSLRSHHSPAEAAVESACQTLSFDSTMPVAEKKPFERLPADVIPSHYNIRLRPNLVKYTFEGSQEIEVSVTKPTKEIHLNCADIVIQEAKFKKRTDVSGDGVKGDDGVVASSIKYDVDAELAILHFDGPLPLGKAKVMMKFTGELNDKMKGFYRSKYKTPDGEDRVLACTQFEATDARRAFPCWDEPALKASFDVTLVVPKDRVALSNMPIKKEEDLPVDDCGCWKVISYERTPVMSTYLLAFVIGEFDYVEGKDSDGVLVRVYTPVGKKEQGDFALDVAVKTLPFYKQYFDIAYPLPKIDLIAIPDFAAGAMENWGLVTYRETALLIDPSNSSSATKMWVALVVGHELAHQWFGNLVTMELWTHLWLNEGFASWIEYLCVDHCIPEFDIWTQFVTSDFIRALDLDALNNSHPIEVPVGHPAEVDEIFDAISYSKGASVIRMLHDYIGDTDFRKGMHDYLTKFQYSNAFTEDLWAALGTASGKPVNKVMTTWTKQMGFPMLQVKVARRDEAGITLNITQSKFSADGAEEPKGSNFHWLVPISFCTADAPAESRNKTLLETKSTEVTLTGVGRQSWVKLNPGTVGVYRVNYDDQLLQLLKEGIANKQLLPRDRLGLQNDLFAFAKAGKISVVEYLKVLQVFKAEENFTVWSDISAGVGLISTLVTNTDFQDSWEAFGRHLFSAVYKLVGWEAKKGEGYLIAMLRSLVLGKVGSFGLPEAVAEAKKRFAAHVKGTNTIPADLRGAVYSTVLKHGDEETFEQMLGVMRETDLHEERVRVLRVLGCVKQPELIKRVLAFSLSAEVRPQDAVFVVGSCTGTRIGRDMTWSFVKERWADFFKLYPGGFLQARLVKFATEGFASEDMAKDIEAFFADHPAPSAERTLQQSLETIRLQAAWLERDQMLLKEHLQKFK